MYIARTPPQIRRAYFHSFVTWQKNTEVLTGWQCCGLPGFLSRHFLTSVLSLRETSPPAPDWMSDLAQQGV